MGWMMAALTVALGSGPSHAVDYDAAPSVLFVPVEPIELVPAFECPVPQAGADNSGLGCVAGLDAATTFVPATDAGEIVAGLQLALEPFQIHVTTTRPPEYVPYAMLLVDAAAPPMASSYTCASASTGCDGLPRNTIASIYDATEHCMAPNRLQSALVAVGTLSGLEHTDEPTDAMYYRPFAEGGGPDWSSPATTFADVCANLVPTIDADDPELTDPLQCPGLYHESYCDGMEGMANSYAEMLGVHGAGPWVEDTTPPSLDALTMPEEGTVLESGGLDLDAMLTDDSGWVFVRWTVQSTALIGIQPADENGAVCKSTNRACPVNFAETPPYYDGADGFRCNEFAALPYGEYTLTLEASDLSGNLLAPVVRHIVVSDGFDESGDVTGDDDGEAGSVDGGSFEDGEDGVTIDDGASLGDEGGNTGLDDGPIDEGSGSGGNGLDTIDRGCACAADGEGRGAAWMLLLLAPAFLRVGCRARSRGSDTRQTPPRSGLERSHP